MIVVLSFSSYISIIFCFVLFPGRVIIFIKIYDYYFFMVNWIFPRYEISLLATFILFNLNYVLPDAIITVPAFFLLIFAW